MTIISFFLEDILIWDISVIWSLLFFLLDEILLIINKRDNYIVCLDRKEAIKKGGTTIKSFTSSEGVHGLFQNELLVHGKKKGICPNCSSSIQVCRIAGRGTYYCPKCQK